jgi:hypothetical protein
MGHARFQFQIWRLPSLLSDLSVLSVGGRSALFSLLSFAVLAVLALAVLVLFISLLLGLSFLKRKMKRMKSLQLSLFSGEFVCFFSFLTLIDLTRGCASPDNILLYSHFQPE